MCFKVYYHFLVYDYYPIYCTVRRQAIVWYTIYMYMYVCIYTYIYICVCVCVCAGAVNVKGNDDALV